MLGNCDRYALTSRHKNFGAYIFRINKVRDLCFQKLYHSVRFSQKCWCKFADPFYCLLVLLQEVDVRKIEQDQFFFFFHKEPGYTLSSGKKKSLQNILSNFMLLISSFAFANPFVKGKYMSLKVTFFISKGAFMFNL